MIKEFDSGWSKRGELLIADLKLFCGDVLLDVHHIGSTAVEGLAAKPIIDIMGKMPTFEVIDHIIPTILSKDSRWHLVPIDLDERPWRRFLVHVIDNHRSAHLHLIPNGEPRWNEHLAFRDTLRKSATLRNSYQKLKYVFAKDHGDDREAYSASKTDFIRAALNS